MAYEPKEGTAAWYEKYKAKGSLTESKKKEAQRMAEYARTKKRMEESARAKRIKSGKASNIEKALQWHFTPSEDYERYPGEDWSGTRVGRATAKAAYRVMPGTAQVAMATDAVRGVKKTIEAAKNPQTRKKVQEAVRKGTSFVTGGPTNSIINATKGLLKKKGKK